MHSTSSRLKQSHNNRLKAVIPAALEPRLAIDTNAYLDPDFLKQYEQLGKAVTVTENFNSNE